MTTQSSVTAKRKSLKNQVEFQYYSAKQVSNIEYPSVFFLQYTGAISHKMICIDQELFREQEEFDFHFIGFTPWRRLQNQLLKGFQSL